MSSSSYEQAKRAKLPFKGGLDPAAKKIDKKRKKRKQAKLRNPSLEEDEAEGEQQPSFGVQEREGAIAKKDSFDLDSGIAAVRPVAARKASIMKSSFPVETKRFGYYTEKTLTREEALDVRVKQKADRYCK